MDLRWAPGENIPQSNSCCKKEALTFSFDLNMVSICFIVIICQLLHNEQPQGAAKRSSHKEQRLHPQTAPISGQFRAGSSVLQYHIAH